MVKNKSNITILLVPFLKVFEMLTFQRVGKRGEPQVPLKHLYNN